MTDIEVGEGLIELLRGLGATGEQLEAASRLNCLPRLPADLVLAQGVTLSARELAARAGLDVESVLALWHILGITVPDAEQPFFTEHDLTFTVLAMQLKPLGEHSGELFRVLGASLARVAEAAVSLYVQTVEPGFGLPDDDVLQWATSMTVTTQTAVQLGGEMGTVFTHHLREAVDRQRTAQTGTTDPSLFRLAVGFVDLVGFTPLSQHAPPSELLGLIGAFEARAFEVAAAHNGRIVKHIGDEVMFTALDAGTGCAIARDLTAAVADGIEPRGGVAYGDVITRHGDYYGPVVNLSARLAELAIPGEVLVDAAAAAAGSGSFGFRPAGHRLLKGFDSPVEVFSLDTGEEG
jgi:adenylate cyclase